MDTWYFLWSLSIFFTLVSKFNQGDAIGVIVIVNTGLNVYIGPYLLICVYVKQKKRCYINSRFIKSVHRTILFVLLRIMLVNQTVKQQGYAICILLRPNFSI